MITQEQVTERLDEILVPTLTRSLVQMNMVRNIEIDNKNLKIVLSKTAVSPENQIKLENEIRTVFQGNNGFQKVEVNYEFAKPVEINQIDKVVAVMSGKGGVGKSLITCLIATALTNENKRVGILDADITGPSIPKMFGIRTQTIGSETGFLPVISRKGIEIMSMNLLLPSEDNAVIWRGPLIAKCINQFWAEVLWGKLDCLLIDMPPGTADIPLTVMKSLPLSGVIIVLTPQDLTAMIVNKAAKMVNQLQIPILGVVENMSYFLIPDTDKSVNIFGKSKGEELAHICNAPLLGKIPLDPELSKHCDEGRIESYETEFIRDFQQSVIDTLLPKRKVLI